MPSASGLVLTHASLLLVAGQGEKKKVYSVEAIKPLAWRFKLGLRDALEGLHALGRNSIHVFEARTRLETFGGNAWLLPLKAPIGGEGLQRLLAFAAAVHTKDPEWDGRQALQASWDFADNAGMATTENWVRFFASELLVAALKVAGAVSPKVNASEAMPQDLEGLGVFEEPQELFRMPRLLMDETDTFGPFPLDQEECALGLKEAKPKTYLPRPENDDGQDAGQQHVQLDVSSQ